MKKVPLIFLLIFCLSLSFLKAQFGSSQSLVSNTMHGPCLDKKFSVVFYLIQDSLYALPTPSAIVKYSLTEAMEVLNKTFSTICVSFEHCKTVIIPNYSYNQWHTGAMAASIFKNWYTENTINIYLPEKIFPFPIDPPETAYTFPPPPAPPTAVVPIDAIVVEKEEFMKSIPAPGEIKGSQFLHAMGHYFGLPHTYEEINPAGASTVIPAPPSTASPPIATLEYVNRTNPANCIEHGDGFCDTEADPFPSYSTANLLTGGTYNSVTNGGLKDGYGDFYVPPFDNLMSAYFLTRCRFSAQQMAYMANVMLTRRWYLH